MGMCVEELSAMLWCFLSNGHDGELSLEGKEKSNLSHTAFESMTCLIQIIPNLALWQELWSNLPPFLLIII